MKLSIAKSELLSSLNTVSKGMSSRSTLPILSGVHLDVKAGKLTLQATDLEVSVRHIRPALIELDGTVVGPGKLFSDIIRLLPDAAVTLELNEGSLQITCQQSTFTIRTLSADDFPKFPELNVEKSAALPASVLDAMVKRVSKAVSKDETRAVLTGVLFVIEGATVRMVATDSYRLALIERVLEAPLKEDLEAVIPGRALDEVARLADSESDIQIGLSQNQVVFEFDDTTFITRRVEGSFPNYKQLIPKETSCFIDVSTEEFLLAVKRVSLLALQNSPLRLSFQAKEQTLSLSSAAQEVGDAAEDVMVKIDGGDIEIAFNHTFLIDGLSSVPTETTRIELQSSLKPGLLKSVEGDLFLYLLMPVRLG